SYSYIDTAPSLYFSAACIYMGDLHTTELCSLSLHDALPISRPPSRLDSRAACSSSTQRLASVRFVPRGAAPVASARNSLATASRSEEHTSELQSRGNLVCRLLLEKKKSFSFLRLLLCKSISK